MKNQNQVLDQLQAVMYHIINNGESSNNDEQCAIEFAKLVKVMNLPVPIVVDFVKGEITREVVLNSEVFLQYVDVSLTPNALQELITDFIATFYSAIFKNYK